LARIFRIAFQRTPLELIHWVKSLRAVNRTDMLIVAGTGVIADYMCGPLGWPYEIFKLSTLAALCRVKLVFLRVGVGPIRHPLSRWFLKRSLALAHHRSYRDEASKQNLQEIAFNTDRDFVCPDVVFGLSQPNLVSDVCAGQRRLVGLGFKDYGSTERLEPKVFQEYLDTMAAFVSWLRYGYGVRLLIGDFQYIRPDRAICRGTEETKPRGRAVFDRRAGPNRRGTTATGGETEAVISARYHNLVMALIQNKPVIALSGSSQTGFTGDRFWVGAIPCSLEELDPRGSDRQIQATRGRHGTTEALHQSNSGNIARALDAQYATLLADPNAQAPTTGGLRQYQRRV
jgi:polysaccharide pyruvyl transferase WcaK-like protein